MTMRICTRFLLAAAGVAALTVFAADGLAQATPQSAPAAATPTAPAAAPTAAPAGPPLSVPVTVVDKKGDPVKSLTAADVTLTDNGHIQTIQSFGPAQPTPATFGLLAQTSEGLKTELGDIRLASVHFVDHTLPGTDDKFFVIQFANEVDLLEDPTGTANKLHDALTQLGSPQFGNQNGGGDSGDQSSERPSHGQGGTLYDAIYLASMEVMRKQPGQHVLVIVGDGVDRDSKETESDAIAAAQGAHAAIFAIYFKPEEERPANQPGQGRRGGASYPGGPGGGGGYPGGGGGYPGGGGGRRGGGGQGPSQGPHIDGKEIFEHMCNATGGYMVEGRKDKAEEAYNKIGALLKNRYTVTWAPDKDTGDSASHHLSLSPKKGDIWTLIQQDYSPAQ